MAIRNDIKNANKISFLEIGDLCRIKNSERTGDSGMKYNDIYSREIHVILEDYGNGAYVVQNINRQSEKQRVNGDRLRKIKMRNEIQIINNEIMTDNIVEEDDKPDHIDFIVQQILDHRRINGEMCYKVWWKGYHKANAEWLPADRLDCQDLIDEYLKNGIPEPKKRKKRSSKEVTNPKRKKRKISETEK
jgi:hypothetical protein